MEEDAHEKLVREYLEYFKAHEAFERTPSVRNYFEVRKRLKTLKILVKERYHDTREFYLKAKEGRRIKNNSRRQK